MGTENESNAKRLTLEDPIGKEALAKLAELENARANLGLQLLDVEHERIKVLATVRKLDEEKQRVFERLLMERGLPPNAPATIDAETGKITILKVPGQPAAAVETSVSAPS